ncbi:MAG: hypothetical protein OQJ81_07175 [Melioribacteraceae bacterium]|nr:hypothetical protein [Melioribacteraceae bacterium]
MSRIILYFFASALVLFAQSNHELDKLQKHYESFEYSKVVQESEDLLLDRERFNDSVLVQIFTLKAASHYAMGEQNETRRSMVELLKIDSSCEINNLKYSPKLISFFEDVKTEFSEIIETNNDKSDTQNKVEKIDPIVNFQRNNSIPNSAIAKSLLLPGLGHLQIEKNTEGWILTSASLVTLGSLIYFIVDANKKEKDYLSETNSELIQLNYDKYNKSYKIRNTLIATYAAIWLYSQIDLLFFSNSLGSEHLSDEISNYLEVLPNDSFALSFKFPL